MNKVSLRCIYTTRVRIFKNKQTWNSLCSKAKHFIFAEKVKELQENTTKLAVNLIKQQRDEGSSDMSVFASTRDLKPQSDETKKELTKEVSAAVDSTVDKGVKRRKSSEESSERRRRAVEEETEEDDEAGISITEVRYMSYMFMFHCCSSRLHHGSEPLNIYLLFLDRRHLSNI
jgi:hypothetical protein